MEDRPSWSPTQLPEKIADLTPVGLMRDILLKDAVHDTQPFHTTLIFIDGLGTPGAVSRMVVSRVAAKNMLDYIPNTDAWNLYLWYLACHPKMDANGRTARDFAGYFGIRIPTKEIQEYADDGWEGLMPWGNPRLHSDPEFNAVQRQALFDWFETHWSDHTKKVKLSVDYIIEPKTLKDFKERLEKHPIPLPKDLS